MASVHKVGDKPNWFCFYTDATGRRRGKTTKTTDRKEAIRVCNNIQEISDKARTGRITPDRARKIIESVVSDILEASGATLDRQTTAEHFSNWVNACEHERGRGTFLRYSGIVSSFLNFLGAKKKADLASLQSTDIERYRDSLTGKVSNATVNTHLKVLRVCLEKAVKKNIFDKNPARLVDNLDPSKRHRRGAFKLDELKRILAVADDEWRGLIRTSLYGAGLRLSDAANLKSANVDFEADAGRGEIVLIEGKTDQPHRIPISKILRPVLEKLVNLDDLVATLVQNFVRAKEEFAR